MRFSNLYLFLVVSFSAHTSLSHKVERIGVNALRKRTSDGRCDPGTYSSTGRTPCTNCAAGTYSKESGQTRCLQARPGYYVPTAGQTTETACSPGTYNTNAGSTGCSSCPPGYMCPSSSMSVPQQCSPGRYSTGGVKDCPRCPAGYFNNIHAATECCACAAGWFNANGGNTNCQQCTPQAPYCNPGATSMGQCSSIPGSWAPSKTSSQGSNGACPVSYPQPPKPSSHPKRHMERKPTCLSNEEACPIFRDLEIVDYNCVDVQSNLESCGGCASYSFDAFPSLYGGRDCSTIPFVDAVGCERGRCKIESCQPGYSISLNGQSCIPVFSTSYFQG